MLGRNVNIRLGINHLGFHIVIAEDNVSDHFNFAIVMYVVMYLKMLDRTLGLEGTDCSISSKNKEITLKQRGGESTTVIKSKYVSNVYSGSIAMYVFASYSIITQNLIML